VSIPAPVTEGRGQAETAVIQTIINRQFLTGLEGAGKVTKDEDGTHHVVPAPVA